MNWNPNSFGKKLWLYFVLFAAMILGALWLLQTVFLQSFYDGMVIKNIENVAAQISAQQDDVNIDSILDSLAYENSLLIFLTDRQGNILYSTDEHSDAYGDGNHQQGMEVKDNPYRNPEESLKWQIGASRHLSLPQDYGSFLQRLTDNDDGIVGYHLNGSTTYVYGMLLPSDTVLYISTALGAVGATVSILRAILIWVTLASLFLAFGVAFLIARKFSQPVSALSTRANSMASGNFTGWPEKGFCSELDELADALNRAASELANTDKFRREFLANVSHDLRTPLTMIRGYAEMVRDISWEDEEKRETDLSIIIRESDRLTGLVNDILEYTLLQSEPQGMDFEDFNISEMVQDVIVQFAPLCEHDSYSIESLVEENQQIMGDKKQLTRVFYNLVDNAISHTGKSKKIQVVLKELGAVIRIEVCDFGEGIPKEDLPFIWERYFSLKQQKRNEKGSGLGLAISKEILRAHGADYGVESEIGQGSTFWVEFRKKLWAD